MSVEFSNVYQEILLDNLVAIIKQNMMFQTQIKMSESVQAKYSELVEAHKLLKQQLHEAEVVKAKADSNASAHEEKSRLQGALNDVMKKKTTLEKELQEKNLEITNLKEYIEKLEGIAPISKLKKINPEKVEEKPVPVETPAQDLFSIKVNDGSSF